MVFGAGLLAIKAAKTKTAIDRLTFNNPRVLDLGFDLPQAYVKAELPVVNPSKEVFTVRVQSVKVLAGLEEIGFTSPNTGLEEFKILPNSISAIGPVKIITTIGMISKFKSEALTVVADISVNRIPLTITKTI